MDVQRLRCVRVLGEGAFGKAAGPRRDEWDAWEGMVRTTHENW